MTRGLLRKLSQVHFISFDKISFTIYLSPPPAAKCNIENLSRCIIFHLLTIEPSETGEIPDIECYHLIIFLRITL